MEYLHKIFSSPDTTAVFMGCLIPMVIVPTIFWAIAKMNRDDNDLKQSMLDRDMSAQEIEQVMNAGSKRKRRGHS